MLRLLPIASSLIVLTALCLPALAQAGDGTALTVLSRPSGFDVRVDGTVVGRTPLFEQPVTPGTHTVELVSDCHRADPRQVEVTSGRTVTVNFEPRAGQATLTIEAADDYGTALRARVYVDGEQVGEAPGTFAVSTCARQLFVEMPDRVDHPWRYESHTETLALDDGEALELDVVLRVLRDGERAEGATSQAPRARKPEVRPTDKMRATFVTAGFGMFAVPQHAHDEVGFAVPVKLIAYPTRSLRLVAAADLMWLGNTSAPQPTSDEVRVERATTFGGHYMLGAGLALDLLDRYLVAADLLGGVSYLQSRCNTWEQPTWSEYECTGLDWDSRLGPVAALQVSAAMGFFHLGGQLSVGEAYGLSPSMHLSVDGRFLLALLGLMFS